MIVMYEMNINLNNNTQNFDEILQTGLAAASILTVNQSGISMEPTVPIQPHPIQAGIILGSVLITIGGGIWILTCYVIMKHSPKTKTVVWKIKNCLILALGISNFWMEVDGFSIYIKNKKTSKIL